MWILLCNYLFYLLLSLLYYSSRHSTAAAVMMGEETLTSGSSSSSADSPLHKVVLGAVKEVFKVSYEIMVWIISEPLTTAVQGWYRIAIMTITLWDVTRNLAINHQASPSTNSTKLVFQDFKSIVTWLNMSTVKQLLVRLRQLPSYPTTFHSLQPHPLPSSLNLYPMFVK